MGIPYETSEAIVSPLRFANHSQVEQFKLATGLAANFGCVILSGGFDTAPVRIHMQPYFAYGSNMDAHQMAIRCPGADRVGIAVLPDYRVLINAQGVGTVIPAKGMAVFGLLWRLSDKNVEALDAYEGVASGDYRREQVTVEVDGARIEVLVYVATNVTPGSPGAGYLEVVLRAAAEVGLPESYLAELSKA